MPWQIKRHTSLVAYLRLPEVYAALEVISVILVYLTLTLTVRVDDNRSLTHPDVDSMVVLFCQVAM